MRHLLFVFLLVLAVAVPVSAQSWQVANAGARPHPGFVDTSSAGYVTLTIRDYDFANARWNAVLIVTCTASAGSPIGGSVSGSVQGPGGQFGSLSTGGTKSTLTAVGWVQPNRTLTLQCSVFDSSGAYPGNSPSNLTIVIPPAADAPAAGYLQTKAANVDLLYTFQDKDGRVIGTQLVKAHETPRIRVDTSSGDVTWTAKTIGGYFDENGDWVASDTQSNFVPGGTIQALALTQFPSPGASGGLAVVNSVDLPDSVKGSSVGVVVGPRETVTLTPTESTAAATSGVVAQGANVVAQAVVDGAAAVVRAIEAKPVGGGVGGGDGVTVDMSGVIAAQNGTTGAVTGVGGKVDGVKSSVDALGVKMDDWTSHIDAVKASVDGVKTSVDAIKSGVDKLGNQVDKVNALEDAKPNIEEMLSQGNARGEDGRSLVESVGGDMSSVPTLPSGSSSAFQLSIAGIDVNLDPALSSGVADCANFVKLLIEWVLATAYSAWVWREVRSMVMVSVLAPQAKGNTFAGTGGQATGLIAASLVTAAIYSAVPVLWAAADSGLVGLGGFWTASDISGAGSAVSAALYLVYYFFPVAFVLGLVANSFVFTRTSLAVFVAMSTVVRYIVP